MKKITTRILSIVLVIMLSVTSIPQMNAIAASGGAETAVVNRNEVSSSISLLVKVKKICYNKRGIPPIIHKKQR